MRSVIDNIVSVVTSILQQNVDAENLRFWIRCVLFCSNGGFIRPSCCLILGRAKSEEKRNRAIRHQTVETTCQGLADATFGTWARVLRCYIGGISTGLKLTWRWTILILPILSFFFQLISCQAYSYNCLYIVFSQKLISRCRGGIKVPAIKSWKKSVHFTLLFNYLLSSKFLQPWQKMFGVRWAVVIFSP